MALKIISWNIDGREQLWRCLAGMDADLALVQEAAMPPDGLSATVCVDDAPWVTDGWTTWPRRTAVAGLSDRVCVDWLTTARIAEAGEGDLAVSRLGTIAAAQVWADGIEPFVAVSMYSFWESPHPIAGGSWIIADASAHRLISDLSALIGKERGHRILAAGDLNILRGYGEFGSRYWAGRYATVFDRMERIGLRFVGPQAPNGRQADPRPDELPPASANVPTYHTARKDPANATRQLDFVFASASMAGSVRVRALNDPLDWGPSDHCRIEIDVGQ